jgi:hypothetical protein
VPRGAGNSVRSILELLLQRRVRFVLVGGVAAVIEGVPVSTFDLDIVHERTPANVDRLNAALRELGAYYRERRDLRVAPDAEGLSGVGHHLLLTRFGPVDILGSIGRGRDFAALMKHTRRRKLGHRYVLVLDLETQIAIKEEVGQAKDRAILPVLRETLRMTKRRSRGNR